MKQVGTQASQFVQLSQTYQPSANQHPRTKAHAETPQQMSLQALAQSVLLENERYYRKQHQDCRYAYELFRRALVERNEMAWEHIYTLYYTLVKYWIRRTSAFAHSGESPETFVPEVFARFWRAIPAEKFDTFPSLASLFNYLQRCAASVIIDNSRSTSGVELLPEEAIPEDHTTQESPEDIALNHIDGDTLWACVNAQLRNDVERVIIHSSFLSGMKPSDIYQKWPHLFTNVHEVYSIKRNILERLSRNRELRRLFA
ncbi:MAG: sigma-70 family RNA polymerase sigma factor [Chloroflexota bacterium]